MRVSRWLRLVLIVTALLGSLVACSDDDGDGVTSTGDSGSGSASGSASGSEGGSGSGSEAAGEAAAGKYCEALTAFQAAVFETDVEEATEEEAKAAHETLGPLWAAVAESAPEAQADAVETLGATIDDLETGDATAFNADETSETYFTMVDETL